MMNLPKISIVTPSYNQGEFLEETIRSVLNQAYPNLEYIIIDGGSTDDSVSIIRSHSAQLAYWCSEADGGQGNAINKGLRRITGDIWGYLCSDDTLLPGALDSCVSAFDSSGADVIYGDCNFLTVDGLVSRVKRSYPFDPKRLIRDNYIWQPSSFVRRGVMEKFGYFDESLKYVMDYEYWLRIAAGARFHYIPKVLSNYRLHLGSKTMGSTVAMVGEARDVKKRYGAGIRADFTYLNFVVWGRYYYRLKRLMFDRLARL